MAFDNFIEISFGEMAFDKGKTPGTLNLTNSARECLNEYLIQFAVRQTSRLFRKTIFINTLRSNLYKPRR